MAQAISTRIPASHLAQEQKSSPLSNIFKKFVTDKTRSIATHVTPLQDDGILEDEETSITKIITCLTGNPLKDWPWYTVTEVVERVNENENNTKEAMRALQRDFKYGNPMTQLSAAREQLAINKNVQLWAILLRNTPSLGFITHSTSPKFTATLEDLISSPHTSPVVQERVLDVIAAAAYANGKPPPLPTGPTHDDIPPDKDIRRLFQECNIGEGNASLLSIALTLSRPEDLETKDVFKELIVAQIPWASVNARGSRLARDLEALTEARTEEQRLKETKQEKLLSSLLSANANLLTALTKHDDMTSAAMESKELENQKVQAEELGVDQRLGFMLSAQTQLHLLLHSTSPVHAYAQSRTPSPMMSPVYKGKDDSMNPWDGRLKSDKKSPKMVEVPSRIILAELPRHDSLKTSEPSEWLGVSHEKLLDYIVQSNRDRVEEMSGKEGEMDRHLQQHQQDSDFLADPPPASGSLSTNLHAPMRTTYAQRHTHSHSTPLARHDLRVLSQGSVDNHSVHNNTQLRTPSPVLNTEYEEAKGASASTYRRFDLDNEMLINGTENHFDNKNLLPSPSESLAEVPARITLAELPQYNSSTTDEPADWLEASLENLLDYIVQSKKDRLVQRECTGWVSGSIPFPHLVIYLYDISGNFEASRAAVAACKNCDVLKALCKYREISDELRRSFDRDPSLANGLRHDVNVMRAIVALDVDVICVRLYRLVTDKEQYRRLVHLQGDDAQTLVDLLQALLDLPTLDRIFRNRFLNALLRLCRRSKRLPARLWQKEISLEGTDAISAGKFGYVWKSKELENQQVQAEHLGMDQRLHPLLHSTSLVHAQSRTRSPMMSLVYEEGKDNSMNPWDGRINSDNKKSPKLVEVPSKIILAELPRYDSLKTSEPAEWLRASHEQLLDYIVQSNGDRTVQRERTGWISSSLPFPHLAIYMYNTTTCDFEALRTAVAVCKDCDFLAALCKFREISDGLCRSFNLGPTPTRSDGFGHAVDVIRNIVALDVDVICGWLYGLLKDKEQYRHLVRLQGDDAQALLDLIQILLDLPSLDRVFRGPFLNTILRLSRRSKLFPGRLWQKEVSLEGSEPITAGKFGEVWKGTFCGQAVAVKVLKIYQRSDLEQHIKNVLQETVIWRQLRHVNVLPFLCLHLVDNSERRIGLVSPWMKNGNVKEFLQQTPDVDRMSLVTDIAEGLEYLHTMEPKIVHGDLKAPLREGPRDGRLQNYWWEIFSGDIPFPKLDEYPVMLAVIRGQRPTRPAQCKNWKTPCIDLGLGDKMWGLIERCWEADAAHRPDMGIVLQDLPPKKHQAKMGGIEHQHFELSSGGLWEDLISWSGLLTTL
ncbi:hypothetical protein DXG01_011067 [Tephrocybe rancida]|nr:hypothetical protein DXG01_011067 [Tephrocybe rancida]